MHQRLYICRMLWFHVTTVFLLNIEIKQLLLSIQNGTFRWTYCNIFQSFVRLHCFLDISRCVWCLSYYQSDNLHLLFVLGSDSLSPIDLLEFSFTSLDWTPGGLFDTMLKYKPTALTNQLRLDSSGAFDMLTFLWVLVSRVDRLARCSGLDLVNIPFVFHLKLLNILSQLLSADLVSSLRVTVHSAVVFLTSITSSAISRAILFKLLITWGDFLKVLAAVTLVLLHNPCGLIVLQILTCVTCIVSIWPMGVQPWRHCTLLFHPLYLCTPRVQIRVVQPDLLDASYEWTNVFHLVTTWKILQFVHVLLANWNVGFHRSLRWPFVADQRLQRICSISWTYQIVGPKDVLTFTLQRLTQRPCCQRTHNASSLLWLLERYQSLALLLFQLGF